MTAAVKLDWAAMLPRPETPISTTDAGKSPAPAPLPATQTAAIGSPDDRVWCSDCQRLAGGKRCKAPAAGLLIASMVYDPVQAMPRRCVAYLPGPNDPDQSPGVARWPWLKETA